MKASLLMKLNANCWAKSRNWEGFIPELFTYRDNTFCHSFHCVDCCPRADLTKLLKCSPVGQWKKFQLIPHLKMFEIQRTSVTVFIKVQVRRHRGGLGWTVHPNFFPGHFDTVNFCVWNVLKLTYERLSSKKEISGSLALAMEGRDVHPTFLHLATPLSKCTKTKSQSKHVRTTKTCWSNQFLNEADETQSWFLVWNSLWNADIV
jgi:hypothetical protein